MNNEKPEKKMIAWNATVEEIELVEELKRVLKRPSTSDLLRYLVSQEAEKILPKHVPIGTERA